MLAVSEKVRTYSVSDSTHASRRQLSLLAAAMVPKLVDGRCDSPTIRRGSRCAGNRRFDEVNGDCRFCYQRRPVTLTNRKHHKPPPCNYDMYSIPLGNLSRLCSHTRFASLRGTKSIQIESIYIRLLRRSSSK